MDQLSLVSKHSLEAIVSFCIANDAKSFENVRKALLILIQTAPTLDPINLRKTTIQLINSIGISIPTTTNLSVNNVALNVFSIVSY